MALGPILQESWLCFPLRSQACPARRWDQAEMNAFAPGDTEASGLTPWPSWALPEPEGKGHYMHRSLVAWREIKNYRMWTEVRDQGTRATLPPDVVNSA